MEVGGRWSQESWDFVRHLARVGALYRRAVIYGASNVTVDLVRALEADIASDIRIAGIFDDRADERVLEAIGRGCGAGIPAAWPPCSVGMLL